MRDFTSHTIFLVGVVRVYQEPDQDFSLKSVALHSRLNQIPSHDLGQRLRFIREFLLAIVSPAFSEKLGFRTHSSLTMHAYCVRQRDT